MKESDLEEKFIGLVARKGGKAYKLVSPGNDGMPDRMVILPGGRIGFVELKQKGKVPRKQQKHRMRELEGLGCFTAVVDDLGSAAEVIAEIGLQIPQFSRTGTGSVEAVGRNKDPGMKGV